MKRVIIGAASLPVAVLAARRFGPALGERAMRKCAQTFERMPEDFPPKRAMRNLDEIRQQNTRILSRLERLERPRGVGADD